MQNILSQYLSYFINFGSKFLIVERYDGDIAIPSIDSSPLTVDKEHIFRNEDQEAEEESYSVNGTSTNNDIFCYLIHEKIQVFESEEPPKEFLSEAGQAVKSQMRLKKRYIMPLCHRVIFDTKNKLRIILVDSRSLRVSENPTDKAKSLTRFLESFTWKLKSHPDWKALKFFQSIAEIYSDQNVGEVTGGYFYTTSGSRYLNTSLGSAVDLRQEPFQLGGQGAVGGIPEFIKIDVCWPEVLGVPRVWIHGSSEMRDYPEKALGSIKVDFSTLKDGEADFLREVINKGNW